MIAAAAPYLAVFFAALAATLVLTPAVRELNRRLGMVDRPGARRINVVPVPRGGGIALVVGVILPYAAFLAATGRSCLQGMAGGNAAALLALSVAIALWGYADDMFSLSPKVKLLGQVVVAALAWSWAGLGFRVLWPSLPAWADCALTVFWIVGAVNAFNLIDGLDGLASGLALIAVAGMAGTLFCLHSAGSTFFYFALMGGLIGFLRYNYNPASVFLGDSGSMFLGFVVSTLPLAFQVPDSFLVSVGVPMLAMGVPIFDTALAILRRSIRRLLSRDGGAAVRPVEIMSADTDHLHHRTLRAAGGNQRKAAWTLYVVAIALVSTGLLAVTLQSHSAGLWMAAVSLAAVVAFKDVAIEVFDAGRLADSVLRSRNWRMRRRLLALTVPGYVVADAVLLALAFAACACILHVRLTMAVIRTTMLVRVVSVFAFLVVFRVYDVVWSRAYALTYMRLLLACAFGAAVSSAFICYWPSLAEDVLVPMTAMFAVSSFVALFGLRAARPVARDLFYWVGRSRSGGDVSRVIVYGAGLRYRALRRELVRAAADGRRIVVGLLDDDVCLRGRLIGGIRVYGTINDAPEAISALKADAVVVACALSDRMKAVAEEVLRPTGVKVSVFSFSETAV